MPYLVFTQKIPNTQLFWLVLFGTIIKYIGILYDKTHLFIQDS